MTMLENEDNIRPLMDNVCLLLSPGCIWKYIDLMKRSKGLRICRGFTVFSVISITGEKLHNRSSIPISHALLFFSDLILVD